MCEIFFFYREFQPMTFAFNDKDLLLRARHQLIFSVGGY